MKRWLWVAALATTLMAVSVQAEDAGKLLTPNAQLKADGMPGIAACLVNNKGHGFARKANADDDFYSSVQFF